MVIGGSNATEDFFARPLEPLTTLEYLSETAWVTQPLERGRYGHAMVVLPCP